MGRLTTHVLDTAAGTPGAGIRIELYALEPERRLLAEARTNADGRCEKALLEGDAFRTGVYELVFHAGDYLAVSGGSSPGGFLDAVPVRFRVADAGEHYHVPLLLSPFGYTTYRGS